MMVRHLVLRKWRTERFVKIQTVAVSAPRVIICLCGWIFRYDTSVSWKPPRLARSIIALVILIFDLIPPGLGLGLLLEGPWTSAALPTALPASTGMTTILVWADRYYVIGGFRRDQECDLLFCWRNK